MEIVFQDKSQGWKNILKIIIPYFIIVGICQLAGLYFAGLSIDYYNDIVPTTKQLFIIMFSGLIGTLTVIWIFKKYVDKKPFISLGFQNVLIVKDIFIGFIFGFIIMLTGFTALLLSNQIEFLNIIFRPVDLILSGGLFLFIAISEELLLRGYMLNNLMTSFNKYVALIISSIVFSILHAANPNYSLLGMMSLFMAGLIFGLAYIYTNNLWFPIALHFSWNFFQGTIFGFNVSGKDTYSLIITKNYTANIWNGGEFGFEGSILSIIFQLMAIILVCLIFKNRLKNNAFFISGNEKVPVNIAYKAQRQLPNI